MTTFIRLESTNGDAKAELLQAVPEWGKAKQRWLIVDPFGQTTFDGDAAAVRAEMKYRLRTRGKNSDDTPAF